MESGWVYTLGEGATMTVAMAGMVCALGGCGSDRATLVMFFGGGLGFLGFRIASVVDAIRGPGEHNDRLRALRQRLGEPPRLDFSVGPSIGPALGGSGGAVAGLTLTF
jgi:hypothetical protein